MRSMHRTARLGALFPMGSTRFRCSLKAGTADEGDGKKMTDGHRAFCMGNALVVGIPHAIGVSMMNSD